MGAAQRGGGRHAHLQTVRTPTTASPAPLCAVSSQTDWARAQWRHRATGGTAVAEWFPKRRGLSLPLGHAHGGQCAAGLGGRDLHGASAGGRLSYTARDAALAHGFAANCSSCVRGAEQRINRCGSRFEWDRLGTCRCSATKGFAGWRREDTALFRKDLGLLQQFFMAKDEHGVVQAQPCAL